MLPMCGAPLVAWAVHWMAKFGIEEIVINLHHHGDQIEAALGDGSAFGVRIQYSKEDPIQGTGGGMRQARSWLDPGDGAPILVANGKLVQDIDLVSLYEAHRESKSEATMAVRRDHEGIWGASLAYSAKASQVTEFLGERGPSRDPSDQACMFCGVHLVEPHFLDRIPQEGAPCIARTAYRELFREKGSIAAMLHEGYWWEHSTPERYLQGVQQVLDGQIDACWGPTAVRAQDPSAAIHESARIDPRSWIGKDVVVGPHARIGAGCQLLDGARIEAGAQLEACVVLEGARVGGRHQRALLS